MNQINYIKKCPICNQKLCIDEIEYNFIGNQNETSICNKCGLIFTFYIRYGKLWKYEKTRLIFDADLCDWVRSENPKDNETIYIYKK